MGPDRYDRVRGYGVGVTPTQLSTISRHTHEATKVAQDARVHRLEEEIEQLRQSRATELQEIEQLQQSRATKLQEIEQSR